MSDVFDLFGDEEPTPTPPRKQAVVVPVRPPTPDMPEPVKFGLRLLDCGHTDWYGDTQNQVALADGFCCEGGRKKMVVSWRDLRGQYVRPVPAHARRTLEKERGPGYPGLCCDHEGYYIGGTVNDCRYGSQDDRRCVVHGGAPATAPVLIEPEPEPVIIEPEPVPVNPPLPPAGASWKQRQLSAKRGKK
jgi:hypothetical protein